MGKRGPHAELNARQSLFVSHYLADPKRNAAQAAIAAGYPARTAGQKGYKLLHLPHVHTEIARQIAPVVKKLGMSRDDVIQELAYIASVDVTNLVQIRGGSVIVRDTSELTEAQRRAIAEIIPTKDGVRVKFWDKTKALETLGRTMALFTDNLNVRVDPLTDLLGEIGTANAARRAAARSDDTAKGLAASDAMSF